MANKFFWVILLSIIILVGYVFFYTQYASEKQQEITDQINEQKVAEEVKKQPKLVKQVVEKIELSNKEKIESIKKTKNSYKAISLENSSEVFFIENGSKLDMYLDDKKIWNFELVLFEFLRVELVNWTINDLYIEVWKNKYYYNFNKNISTLIELKIDVEYVKKGNENWLIFVTNKWSFVYSFSSKSLEYFSYFNDFSYLNDWYIWIVREYEKRILKNLWFETENNLIVYYNSTTKEKNILYKTDLDIKKLYIFLNTIYIVTNDWELYVLENVE